MNNNTTHQVSFVAKYNPEIFQYGVWELLKLLASHPGTSGKWCGNYKCLITRAGCRIPDCRVANWRRAASQCGMERGSSFTDCSITAATRHAHTCTGYPYSRQPARMKRDSWGQLCKRKFTVGGNACNDSYLAYFYIQKASTITFFWKLM